MPTLGAGINSSNDNNAFFLFILRFHCDLSQLHDVKLAGAEVGNFFDTDQVVLFRDIQLRQVTFG